MFDRTNSKVIKVKDSEIGKRYQVLMGYQGCPYVWNMHNHEKGTEVSSLRGLDFRTDEGHWQCYCADFLIRKVE